MPPRSIGPDHVQPVPNPATVQCPRCGEGHANNVLPDGGNLYLQMGAPGNPRRCQCGEPVPPFPRPGFVQIRNHMLEPLITIYADGALEFGDIPRAREQAAVAFWTALAALPMDLPTVVQEAVRAHRDGDGLALTTALTRLSDIVGLSEAPPRISTVWDALNLDDVTSPGDPPQAR